MKTSLHSKPDARWRTLEIALPLFLIISHGLVYNAVGALAGSRGLDFGPSLMTDLDRKMPFLPSMVVPYMVAWIYPVLPFVILLRRGDSGLVAMRRILATLVAAAGICYCIWVTFPVKVSHRIDEAALGTHGWLGSLVSLNYAYSTPWNACPSFHVVGPWLFFRAAHLNRVRCLPVLFVLFLAIALSTVTIRIHYLFDIVAGFLVAEFCFRFLLAKFDRQGAFLNYSSKSVSIIYFSLILLAGIAWIVAFFV